MPKLPVYTLAMKQPVTHEGYFNINRGLQKPEQRIFSGVDTPVILTVTLLSPPTNSEVDVLVNTGAIPDGVIKQSGTESRTFKITNANVIDIKLVKSCTSAYGRYTISVYV
jgi:hypothetical protein